MSDLLIAFDNVPKLFYHVALYEGRYSKTGEATYRILQQLIQGELIKGGTTMSCLPQSY